MTLFRTWAALALVFAAAVLSIRVLTIGVLALDARTVAALVLVPTAQVCGLAVVRRFRSRR